MKSNVVSIGSYVWLFLLDFPQKRLPVETLYVSQWRSEAKCRPGPTIKVPPFPPLKFSYKIKNERSCFVLI